MASVFRRDDNFVEQPNRNTYDMSFQNNLTLDFGSLRPCFCQPVSPGDSWSIEPTFGLRFLPMVYPVQTRMKASIHYFYVRNRNLWKDWQDFIGKTKTGLVPPYINLNSNNRKMIETSQLGDFLGIPTIVYDKVYTGGVHDLIRGFFSFDYESGWFLSSGNSSYTAFNTNYFSQLFVGDDYDSVLSWRDNSESPYCTVCGNLFTMDDFQDNLEKLHLRVPVSQNSDVQIKLLVFGGSGSLKYISDAYTLTQGYNAPYDIEIPFEVDSSWFDSDSASARPPIFICIVANKYDAYLSGSELLFGHLEASEIDVSQKDLADLPWRSDDNVNGIPLSALPFRAYESIYNAFYRNAENNPLLINGVPEYNKWIRTNDGGADNNYYPIMYHNWEDDFLTTAVPSPQQGNAPLVGLSGTPTLTIGHEDGTTTIAQLNVDDEGNITAVTPMSGDEPTQQSLIEAVSYGISINDFRNVNSFQRWLENNIRRGYKYKDQIKTHYGVSVRYDELDMPEFIGGTSEPVIVNQISQTTPTETSPLGDMAGQASAFGQGRSITHYCDEHGFIIGIICVKPVANYSQLLPKYFNVTDAFDYYFPEFGHIGMQPITYAEVTPLQANLEGKLNDTFGYQRAWYDLISKTDEVHGLFRSDFRNFLINRTFDGTPELGKEFTVMDPEQINDVFAFTENTDKILGQVFMKCSKKTPIPLYGIPKLE